MALVVFLIWFLGFKYKGVYHIYNISFLRLTSLLLSYGAFGFSFFRTFNLTSGFGNTLAAPSVWAGVVGLR